MYIKSVSLRGFKSFVSKVKLEFEPGLIAIVGPNGSGKSNIVDAILWVLGEQSAKLLRGESMEDVIFAGSSIHPPFGMTDVCIVLDNSDKVLPVEFSEVSLSRELFRSGESHYLLNGRQSKLNDIRDLLSDAALGKGLYSIVSQGRIEEIISSKPDERRHVVDEAAGVLKHRLRREKTEKRLKDEEDKILRANDIYIEIKRQLKPLERQAEDAKRYIETTDELKQLEISYLARKILNQKNEWNKCLEDEEILSNSQDVIRPKIEDLIKQNNRLKEQATIMVDDNEKFIGRREKSLVVNENINYLLQRIEEALGDTRNKIFFAGKELNELVQNKDQLQFFSNDHIEELMSKQIRTKNLIDKLKSEENEKNQKKLELVEKIEQYRKHIEFLDNRIREESMLLNKLNAEQDQGSIHDLTSIRESYLKEIEELESHLSETGSVYKKLLDNHDQLISHYDAMKEETDRIDGECKDLINEKNVLELKISSKKAKAEALFEIYGKKTKKIPKLKWLLPLVDHIKSLPKEYEDHVLSIFEQEIEGLLVKEKKRIFDAINIGRHTLTMLPLAKRGTDIKEKNVLSLAEMVNDSSVPFLCNIFIAKDFDTAIHCQEKYLGKNIYFVFEDKIFTPYGSIRFTGKADGSIINLKKRIGELDSGIMLDEKRVKELTITIEKLDEKKYKLHDSLKNLLQELEECKKQKYESKAGLEAAHSQLKNLKDAEAQLDEKIALKQKSKDMAEEQVKNINKILVARNKEFEDTKKQLQAERDKLDKLQKNIDELNRELSSKTYEESSIVREIGQTSDNIENIRSLTGKREKRLNELKELEISLASKEKSFESLLVITSRLSAISSRLNNSITAKRNEINQELENIGNKQKQLNLELEELNMNVRDLDSKINQIQIKKAEVRVKLSDLKTQLEDGWESDIDSAVSAIDTELKISEIAEKIRNMKSMLARMGPVNMIALDELAALKERENLYRDQLDDLAESKRSLLGVIKELNDSMTSTFINFFEKFANNFQSIIEEFFSGGRGKLSLSNPDDILNSGIEIEIQPAAGKKFQNLSLLSGGEKAMAALCFLFSLFMSRPTPFCIMDEVDAALDDFNITRLINFLENMKKNSQIILITHQKRTMEIADIIFGVSTEPDGTSKILSQKIEVTA